MIHKQLKPGHPILKFEVPVADFPYNQTGVAPTYEDGFRNCTKERSSSLYHEPETQPTFTHNVHLVAITESRRARNSGDSFPAFMAPIFESLGFQVLPIENPKSHIYTFNQNKNQQKAYDFYKDLPHMYSVYSKMPFAYDLSVINRIRDYVLAHPETFDVPCPTRTSSRYYIPTWNYQQASLISAAAYPIDDFPNIHYQAYSSLNEVHMIHDNTIRRKQSLPSTVVYPSMFYDMPQVKVIGVRCLLVSNELYDALPISEEVTQTIEEKVEPLVLSQMKQFFSLPVSFESTAHYYMHCLFTSTITMPEILKHMDESITGDPEARFYKAFLKTVKEFYLVSSHHLYNEKLSSSNTAKRQPTNIFYAFRRPVMNLFKPSNFRPIKLLEPSI